MNVLSEAMQDSLGLAPIPLGAPASDVRERLDEAAAGGDQDAALSVIAGISQTEPGLRPGLECLVKGYQFDKVLDLLAKEMS